MPIDASSHPFDDGRELDLDDLDRAGTGASVAPAAGKALGALDDDDDLDKAGKGAGDVQLDDDGTKTFGDTSDDDVAGGDDPFDVKLGLERAVDDPFHADHDFSGKHDALGLDAHDHDDDVAFAAKHHHVDDLDDPASHDKSHIDLHDLH